MSHLYEMPVEMGNAIFYRTSHLYEMPVPSSPLISNESGYTKPYRAKYNNMTVYNNNMLPHLLSCIAGGFDSKWLFRLSKPLVFHPFYHTVSDVYLPHIHPLYKPKKIKDFENDLEFLLHRFQLRQVSMKSIFTDKIRHN